MLRGTRNKQHGGAPMEHTPDVSTPWKEGDPLLPPLPESAATQSSAALLETPSGSMTRIQEMERRMRDLEMRITSMPLRYGESPLWIFGWVK